MCIYACVCVCLHTCFWMDNGFTQSWFSWNLMEETSIWLSQLHCNILHLFLIMSSNVVILHYILLVLFIQQQWSHPFNQDLKDMCDVTNINVIIAAVPTST